MPDPAGLKDLDPDVLCIIFSYLDTCQSIARLASTCRSLHEVVRTLGWPTFVRAQFGTLAIPHQLKIDEWKVLAKRLTWQSRAWDLRAFSLSSVALNARESILKRGGRNRGRNGRGRGGQHRNTSGGARSRGSPLSQQTLPAYVVVDAHSTFGGALEKEIVAWGLGEDIVVRWRDMKQSCLAEESWMAVNGAALNLRSGVDDVTAISILNDVVTGPALLVGRASGSLQLMSTNKRNFGHVFAFFLPTSSGVGKSCVQQNHIQHFDTNVSSRLAAVITKDNMFIYPLTHDVLDHDQYTSGPELTVRPIEAFNLHNMEGTTQFGSLRAVRFMSSGNLAFCATKSTEPVQHLLKTPTGMVVTGLGKRFPSNRCAESFINDGSLTHSARDLLPVNATSFSGGSGNSILSSYDDGTVRLQDLRSPAAFDTIYQDHFEIVAPMGPLISYDMQRFIAGSARTSILKIFDYRWTRSYSYIDALPCSEKPMVPTPKSLTLAPFPEFPKRDACCYMSGHRCYLHALARTDFYRPNCNVYLSTVNDSPSPVYSLAKPSDLSSSVYAGLSGELSKLGLRDNEADLAESIWLQQVDPKSCLGYGYHKGLTSIVETGDGIALSDISKSKRLPALYKQKHEPLDISSRPYQRLDESLF
ncbi:hypothetical protein QM012_001223 [Aureobasidium pullulans]|uniref:F-box domain-containing protein n=1 Tax=Aureobasidium pullulans TaxID=5580 RepID=A0ABR0TG15_AURPU